MAAGGRGGPRLMHSPGVEVGLAHGAAPQGLRTVHQGLLLGVGNPAGLRRGAPLPGPGRWPGAHPSPAEHPIRAPCALASRWCRREGCPGKGLRSHSEDLGGRGALGATPGLLQDGSSGGGSGASAPARPGDPTRSPPPVPAHAPGRGRPAAAAVCRPDSDPRSRFEAARPTAAHLRRRRPGGSPGRG